MTNPLDKLLPEIIAQSDATVADYLAAETERQYSKLGLIPSENHSSPAVLAVLSSCLSSKYAEGYSKRRYYEGNQHIDELELLAIERIKTLFNAGAAAQHKTNKGQIVHVNVQPYSGSPANSAIQFALLNPGDTLMGLALSAGGHLTHGQPQVTFSGKYFKSVQFGLTKEARIDYDQVRALALEHKPKLMMVGTTAYPFELDFEKFRSIADEVGAWLIADISHITGLVVTGLHQSPVPYADVIMSTTHKTFRGPRGAMILVTERGVARDPELAAKIDKAVFPGLQGGPHNATTAGIAIAALEAQQPGFAVYAKNIRANAVALAKALQNRGFKLVGDGTDNHLLLIDLTPYGDGFGTQVAFALDVAGIYANRNTIPNEPCSPFYPSGLRIGTPLITTRGLEPKDMEQLADWMARVVKIIEAEQLPKEKTERGAFLKDFRTRTTANQELLAIAKEVAVFAKQFPLFKS
jgi:glycine hydroxymethyltransferase